MENTTENTTAKKNTRNLTENRQKNITYRKDITGRAEEIGQEKSMSMGKNRMKKWIAAGFMVLIILTAVYMLNCHSGSNPGVHEGICWRVMGYELLLLAGGYGLAAVMMGKQKKKRMRRDVLSHVG